MRKFRGYNRSFSNRLNYYLRVPTRLVILRYSNRYLSLHKWDYPYNFSLTLSKRFRDYCWRNWRKSGVWKLFIGYTQPNRDSRNLDHLGGTSGHYKLFHCLACSWSCFVRVCVYVREISSLWSFVLASFVLG